MNQKLTPHKSIRKYTMPLINRGHMTSQPWNKFWNIIPSKLLIKDELDKVAEQRRLILLLLTMSFSFLASFLIKPQIINSEGSLVEYIQLGLFFILFMWISMGFVTALMGAYVAFYKDKYSMTSKGLGIDKIKSRTAIVMTICNEDTDSVFSALKATIGSVDNNPHKKVFDFFILSDTNDKNIAKKELEKYNLLKEYFPYINIYYRKRIYRTKKKSGNVEDFCRRWGNNYDYMVVLDADSVMTGECLEKLTRLMDENSLAGIIQTIPKTFGHDTLHARVEQFSSRMMGKLFTLGMQFWQLGESHYWGHNAIIRVKPFMEHCSLSKIKGKGNLSGAILSHDFVEAALMRRAGYKVFICADLEGSYEQQPPNMLAELQRDRRWCQGNIQNIQLLTQPNLHMAHRAMLLTGIMSYLSAPIWLAFIILGSLSWIFDGNSLLNISQTHENIQLLWLLTAVMLMAPRFMGLLTAIVTKESIEYGGVLILLKSTLLEMLLSILKAPIKMAAHSLFVLGALSGLKIEWKSPPREALNLKWIEVVLAYWSFTGSAISLLIIEQILNPNNIVWLLPVCVPLILSIPFTLITGKVEYGLFMKNAGFLLIPEEIKIPLVIQEIQKNMIHIKGINFQ